MWNKHKWAFGCLPHALKGSPQKTDVIKRCLTSEKSFCYTQLIPFNTLDWMTPEPLLKAYEISFAQCLRQKRFSGVRTSCPPHPLYAELHLCFVFSVFFSISAFQWAYYLNEQYQSVLVTSTSSCLYFLGSSEHWDACCCHKNVLSNSTMDLVHNAMSIWH